MADLPPKINYHVTELLKKACAREEKIKLELAQLTIQITIYEKLLNGESTLDPFLEEKIRQDMR